ncbi:hypothetical protein [Rhizosaccharibacter radicis]|uniref:Lipoprotein n=1 Tax=Rhizosaccharibacter radicis TaxID=2782605 RepID=A0ABT1W174_9PROT|nr:hypothetical protein [Acetobacteraceae bacterium KSS12]
MPLVPPARCRSFLVLMPLLLGACAVNDARVADRAQKRLVGLQEVDLEACLGVPDQHATFGDTDVLTYYATSSSSMSYSIPIVGGLGMSNGGYCHATFRVDGGRVSQVLYSGEKNQTFAPNAYCAPIVRTCIAYLDAHPDQRSRGNPDARYKSGGTDAAASSGTVPPGAASAAPQPGASNAAMPANMPTPTPR